MGVHGLWRLIDSAGKPIPIETLENKVLAVDVSIWLYQLVKGFRERAERSVNNPFLLGLFHRILKLLFYRIKPVFVFDGGVPLLKKRTIAARQRNRSKANEVSDKLKRTLLENLAKQHVLGKALGEGDLQIPKMLQPKPDMFYLPPLPEKAIESDEESSSSDDANHKKYRTADLHSIDITSEEFLSLPADMRHDILTELKETRKQNSWAKVHLMPENSTDFSDFQMGRLLKRRAIQVGLEKAEGEMGTRGYTIADIQEILKGHGIEVGQRIAADNTTRFLYASNDPDRTLNINEIPSKRIRKIFDSDLIDNIIESDDEISQNLEEFEVDEPYLKISNDGLSQKEIFDLIKEGNRNGKSINTTINVDINQPSTSKLPETFVIEQNLDSTKVDKINENKEIAIEKQVNDQNLEHENNFSGDNEKLKLDHEILPRIDIRSQNETLFSNNHQVKMKSNVNSYKLPEFTISSKNVKAETIVDNIHSFDRQDKNNTLSLLDDNVINKSTSENNQDPSKKKEIIGKVEENDSSKIVFQSTSVEVSAKLSQSDNDNDLMEVNESIENNESSPVIKTSIPQLSSASSLEQILVKTETIIDNSNSFDSQDKNNTSSLLDDNVVSKVTSENNQDVSKKVEIDSSKTVCQPSSVEVPVELSQSDSDDDFMEVNENIEDNESSPVIQTTIPQLSSASALEILVKPDEINEDEEDIFADVFDKNSSVEISKISVNVETCVDNKEIQGSNSISNNKLNLSTEKIDSKDSCEIKLPLESEKADEVIDKNANIDVGKDIKAEDSVEVPNETSKSNENDKTADNYFKTKQLNLEEIISLKSNLEKESAVLMEETNREERLAATISQQITIEAQELLRIFGLPYIVAPMEAEAQCAYLDITGQTQGTITDDSDIWLFGANNVYKNFFDQKKFVKQFKASDIQRVYHLCREDLIMVAMLTGSDYTTGIPGIGPVNALEIIAQFAPRGDSIMPDERLKRFHRAYLAKNIDEKLAKKLENLKFCEGFPSSEVVSAYLKPAIDDSKEPFSWGSPNLERLRKYTHDKFGWDKAQADKVIVPVLNKLKENKIQRTMHNYFEWAFDGVENKMSRRVEKAVNILGGKISPQKPLMNVRNPQKPTSSVKKTVSKVPFNSESLPLKSKTPAQLAREKAAKKLKEIRKQEKEKKQQKGKKTT